MLRVPDVVMSCPQPTRVVLVLKSNHVRVRNEASGVILTIRTVPSIAQLLSGEVICPTICEEFVQCTDEQMQDDYSPRTAAWDPSCSSP